jgi:hypothetical protein
LHRVHDGDHDHGTRQSADIGCFARHGRVWWHVRALALGSGHQLWNSQLCAADPAIHDSVKSVGRSPHSIVGCCQHDCVFCQIIGCAGKVTRPRVCTRIDHLPTRVWWEERTSQCMKHLSQIYEASRAGLGRRPLALALVLNDSYSNFLLWKVAPHTFTSRVDAD